MRKNITILAVALLSTVAFFSCKKKDNNSPSTGSMTATINGASYNGSVCSGAVTSGELIIASTPSTTTTNPVIGITVANYSGVGTYSLADTTTNTGSIDSVTTGTGAIATSHIGTVTITSATATSIVGTFSFTCSDGTVLSNGTFTALEK